MSSWTRLVSRVASSCIRPAKRLTASGSSEASMHGLGEQRERADRGLELMADVGDEVAADGLDPAGLGEVLDQQQDQPGAERGDPGGDGEGLAPAGAAPRQVQLDLPDLAVPPGVAGHPQHRLDGELAAADQPEGVRGGAGLDDGVAPRRGRRRRSGVPTARCRPGRQHGVRVQRGARGLRLVALAPAERQHGEDTGAQPGERRHCGDRRVHVHALQVMRRSGHPQPCRAPLEHPSPRVHRGDGAGSLPTPAPAAYGGRGALPRVHLDAGRLTGARPRPTWQGHTSPREQTSARVSERS